MSYDMIEKLYGKQRADEQRAIDKALLDKQGQKMGVVKRRKYKSSTSSKDVPTDTPRKFTNTPSYGGLNFDLNLVSAPEKESDAMKSVTKPAVKKRIDKNLITPAAPADDSAINVQPVLDITVEDSKSIMREIDNTKMKDSVEKTRIPKVSKPPLLTATEKHVRMALKEVGVEDWQDYRFTNQSPFLDKLPSWLRKGVETIVGKDAYLIPVRDDRVPFCVDAGTVVVLGFTPKTVSSSYHLLVHGGPDIGSEFWLTVDFSDLKTEYVSYSRRIKL